MTNLAEVAVGVRKRTGREDRRLAMPKIPRWLVGVAPKVRELPVIELRRREELIPGLLKAAETVELPRVSSSSRVKRPRQVWD